MTKFIPKNLAYKMKKYITTSLFIFVAIVVGVAIVSLIFPNSKSNQSAINNPVSGVNSGTTGTNLILSIAELAKHNSASNCWLLINGKIYDVTSFLYQHPGNAGTILPTCGTDATVAYDTKGRPNGRPHSANANAMLADYFIGNLN